MKTVAALFLALFVSGCATIAGGGKTQSVSFNSEPQEANVAVNGRVVGKTPVTVTLERQAGQTITFEKAGYKTFSSPLETKINPWFFGNILLGGVFGSTTDAASGAMNEYSPNAYYATLVTDSGVEQTSRARELRQLLVGNGKQFRLEVAASSGEVLSSILTIIDVKEASRTQAIAALKQLALTTPYDLVLANKIVEIYELK